MDKQNRMAAACLLAGVAAAGRALLAMPDAAGLQELSLTVLAVVGYLLVCRRTALPLACGVAQLALELVLCGNQSGGAWVWLLPALRAADLWLLLAAVRSEEHTSELQSPTNLVCRLLLEKIKISKI